MMLTVLRLGFVAALLLGLLSGISGAEGQPPCTVTVKPGESIQSAIDGAKEGAVICLGAGTYEENITIKKGLTLRGTGAKPEEVWIVGVKERYPVMRIEREGEIEVQLENLTAAEAKGDDGIEVVGKAKAVIRDVQVSGNLYGLDVGDSATVSLTNSQVSDNRGWGLSVWDSATVSLTSSQVSGNVHGLWVRGSATVTLSNSQVSGNEWPGLEVEDSATVSLTNSQVSDNGLWGLLVRDLAMVSLTNSQVSDNGLWGLLVKDLAMVSLTNSQVSDNGYGLVVSGSARVEIKESTLQDNRGCGIEVFSKEAQVRGTPNKMRGNGADLCGFAPASLRQPLAPPDPRPKLVVPTDYATIQEAIDAILPGGTVEVAAGSYEVGLTIWKPVVLLGAGRDQTILEALPERGLVLSIIAEAQGVRIEGFQVKGSKGAGLLIYGREVTIQGALISGNGDDGLSVSGSARVSLTDSQVSGNGYGLSVSGSAEVSLTNSQVSGNRLWGLWVWGSATVEVRSSTIEGNGTDPECQRLGYICNGIRVSGESQTTITDSKIRNNTDWGVAAWLKKCGYYFDEFSGRVVFQGRNVIEGNNKSGNHEGNPGWSGPPLPDGQVCLP